MNSVYFANKLSLMLALLKHKTEFEELFDLEVSLEPLFFEVKGTSFGERLIHIKFK